VPVDFLIHSHVTEAAALSGPDEALNERHWSYLDAFAGVLTARGPTLAPDRETWTGSMHVLDLPSDEHARTFVADEPYERAGLFASHDVWRFSNLLGRSMWERTGDLGGTTYLVFIRDAPVPLPDGHLLMSGELHTLDGEPAGYAAAVEVQHHSVLDGLVGARIHDWERGGRR
jgi:uncharacterized protein YciI